MALVWVGVEIMLSIKFIGNWKYDTESDTFFARGNREVKYLSKGTRNDSVSLKKCLLSNSLLAAEFAGEGGGEEEEEGEICFSMRESGSTKGL